jgi:hypothetical protein
MGSAPLPPPPPPGPSPQEIEKAKAIRKEEYKSYMAGLEGRAPDPQIKRFPYYPTSAMWDGRGSIQESETNFGIEG